jgi:SIT family siderophore-iron:H+ symporter-like MFS transporter
MNACAISSRVRSYQFGSTGLLILAEIVIADTTSLRNRLFWSIVPASPFIIK